MSWVEEKYVSLLSSRLNGFRRVSQTTWNFKCPLCISSDPKKKKGYIYQINGEYRFHCHRCNSSMWLSEFIKTQDSHLYTEYIKDKFFTDNTPAPIVAPQEIPPVEELSLNFLVNELTKVSQLAHSHSCKRYVVYRKIPTNLHSKLFYVKNFCTWVNSFIPNKFSESSISKDEGRLIIPFVDKLGIIFGFQGRSLKNDSPIRYITIMLDKTVPRFYGLDQVNFEETVYILEGPIDSMFVPNSIASAGGDITRELTLLGKPNVNFVVVYDNEPRNKSTLDKMASAISRGHSVCIWPQSLEIKDVNDMISSGISSEEIIDIIRTNTYNGLSAKMALSVWRK